MSRRKDYTDFYQMDAVQSVYQKNRMLIAYGMGIGKTKIGPMLYQYIKSKGHDPKAFVVCPGIVREHWKDEIYKYITGNPNVVIIDGYKEKQLEKAKNAEYVIASYSMFSRDGSRNEAFTDYVLSNGHNLVIFDEVQNTKNPKAYRSSRLSKVADQAEWFAALSGTPIPNKIKDIYQTIRLLEPEVYPTAKHVAAQHRANGNIIQAVLNNRRLYRSSDDVLDLPPLNFEHVEFELSGPHKEVYEYLRERDDLEAPYKLIALRKATLDPGLVDPELIGDSTMRKYLKTFESCRYEILDEILKDKVAKGEKSIVFCPQFRCGVTKKLEERFKKYGALRIDGTVLPIKKRIEILKKLKMDSESYVLFATPETIGEGVSAVPYPREEEEAERNGIDIIPPSNVIHLMKEYAPGEVDQDIARVHRRWQTLPVDAISIIATNSIDSNVEEMLEAKRKAIYAIVHGEPYYGTEHESVLIDKTHETPPMVRGMYTPAQLLRRRFAEWAGRGTVEILEQVREGGRKDEDFAKNYSSSDYTYPDNVNRLVRQVLEELVEDGDLDDIIDLGAGQAELSKAFEGDYPITNIDLLLSQMRYGKEYSDKNVVAKMHELPFNDKEFAVATCIHAFHWPAAERSATDTERDQREKEKIYERQDSAREAYRVARKYYILTFPEGVEPENDEKFYEAFDKLGFDIIPELTGYVKGIEPEGSDFSTNMYVFEINTGPRNEEEIDNEGFYFNIDSLIRTSGKNRRRGSGNIPQSTKNICTKFAFVEPEKEVGIDVRNKTRGYKMNRFKHKFSGAKGSERMDLVYEYYPQVMDGIVPEKLTEELDEIGWGIEIQKTRKRNESDAIHLFDKEGDDYGEN